jgi:hypothetical protein
MVEINLCRSKGVQKIGDNPRMFMAAHSNSAYGKTPEVIVKGAKIIGEYEVVGGVRIDFHKTLSVQEKIVDLFTQDSTLLLLDCWVSPALFSCALCFLWIFRTIAPSSERLSSSSVSNPRKLTVFFCRSNTDGMVNWWCLVSWELCYCSLLCDCCSTRLSISCCCDLNRATSTRLDALDCKTTRLARLNALDCNDD